MRPLNSLSKEQYDVLNSTGFLFELYPKATGNYEKDLKASEFRTEQRVKARRYNSIMGVLVNHSEEGIESNELIIHYHNEDGVQINYFNWLEVYDEFDEIIYFGKIFYGGINHSSIDWLPVDIKDKTPFIDKNTWESFFDNNMYARAYVDFPSMRYNKEDFKYFKGFYNDEWY